MGCCTNILAWVRRTWRWRKSRTLRMMVAFLLTKGKEEEGVSFCETGLWPLDFFPCPHPPRFTPKQFKNLEIQDLFLVQFKTYISLDRSSNLSLRVILYSTMDHHCKQHPWYESNFCHLFSLYYKNKLIAKLQGEKFCEKMLWSLILIFLAADIIYTARKIETQKDIL